MAAISSIYARKQIANAVRLSDKAPLYDMVDLTPETAQDPSVMVPFPLYLDLLETIAESEWPDLQFHMKTCASMRCDEFGVFGLAFKTAPTIQQGFQRISQYIRLHNRVSDFYAEQRGDQYVWSVKGPPVTRLGAALSHEAALATTLTLCREATGTALTPKHVQFVHEREGSIEALVAHFGCEPQFGAETDAMIFDMAQVTQASALGDVAIWEYMTQQLDQALEQLDGEVLPFEAQVIEEIAKLLSGGVPHLSEVSSLMGLGERTFQRRLSERGKTFQALVDQARHQLAQQLVAASSYSLVEIAFLTGFSEQSAFSRAFKRWSGQSPKAYRLSLQDGALRP
ncbi:AraC family transcriptional regulator ligand-binding domain-containing protein [Shimia sp. R11_0]|uniref:AraC family transcriptional regulator n=1 Tax=Shimia sp. R11_0 TaxID=2821096 RepID=UPI001ADB008E|nr:AraC family transcriptional regulator ligand-binding domain-containing protein [Shimia sp. R11_0]